MPDPVLDPLRHGSAPPGAPRGVWADPARLQPGWSAPRRLGSLPRWVLVTVPLVLVAALVTLVAVLGGFGTRQDRIVRLPADSVIVSGPYRLTFTTAVASAGKDLGDKPIWKVDVRGTVQTTDDVGDQPGTDSFAFLVLDVPTNPDVVNPESVRIGTRLNRSYAAGQVTPGLGPVPITWSFNVPSSTALTAEVRIVVFDQEYGDITLTRTGEQTWHRTKNGHEVLLPLVVVPADD